MSWNEKARGDLREQVRINGPETTEKIILEALKKDEIKPDEFSIKELWEGFYYGSKTEAVGTGSFEKITTALIHKKLIEGYETVKSIGDNFVTTVPGKLKKETIAGMSALVFPQEVPEGANYEGVGTDEKYVTIKTTKQGRIIEITEEMVQMDQTTSILLKAKGLGEMCKQKKEKLIVQGIQDVNSNVYNPSDTATALYRTATPANLVQNNSFNAAGLAAVEKLCHNMTDDSVEENFVTIDLVGKPLLVPVDLMEEAWELATSRSHPETAERVETSYWFGKFVPYTSPYVTEQSSTTWYWGDFKKDFLWVEIYPLQTFTARQDNYRQFEADIYARIKYRFYGGIGAIDYRHSFQSTA